MKRSTVCRALFVGVAALLATASVATPGTAAGSKPIVTSSAQPAGPVPGGFASWTDLFTLQNKLNVAATRILAAGGAGNAGIVAAPESRRVDVYWKGQVPASVRQLAGRLGVPVVFHRARFSQSELAAEARRVAADPRVATAAPRQDGSGLQVTVAGGVTATGTSAGGGVLGTSRVPVTVTAGDRPHGLIGRQADTPPFWGGARYNTPIGGCSTGFAIFPISQPPPPVGGVSAFDLSAAHCANVGNAANVPGQPVPTGSVIIDTNPRDTLIINFPAGAAGRVYTGPFNSATSRGVGAAVPDFVGNVVTTSGASSGEHPNGAVVTAVNQFVNIGIVIGPETFAQSVNGACIAAPGDSGGPVYSFRTDGRVDARGTISAGVTNVACPGVVPQGSNVVWYAPLLRPAGDPQIGALQFYGAGVVLG